MPTTESSTSSSTIRSTNKKIATAAPVVETNVSPTSVPTLALLQSLQAFYPTSAPRRRQQHCLLPHLLRCFSKESSSEPTSIKSPSPLPTVGPEDTPVNFLSSACAKLLNTPIVAPTVGPTTLQPTLGPTSYPSLPLSLSPTDTRMNLQTGSLTGPNTLPTKIPSKSPSFLSTNGPIDTQTNLPPTDIYLAQCTKMP